MAFWLARERDGQQSDHIQRFDPRFWTVDFPRPMMAGVRATGPDSLRVECEFHHTGELAGLIWDCEDKLDHPLLAYETKRDFSRTILSFRWRSAGLMKLDRPHGPTLTIEGRDASGTPRSWYVRLWNYATGSPSDARIELRFSELESGYGLLGETVHPADIDRMFISLVHPFYIEGGTERLAARANSWAEMTEMRCTGQHDMLEIGDVMMPAHGEQVATAYDDAYNQTPQRLVRTMRGLGYRGRAIQYVGMSHFFRVAPAGDRMEVTADAQFAAPARSWFKAFFAECKAKGFEVIASLSYELFAEHCPDGWQQRAWDGAPARTGWVPPSALLSPANPQAMAWLQAAAAEFVRLLKGAGLPVLFQIGEPWWWVMADGAPCLYDDAAKAALGGNPPVIESLKDALDAGQLQLLDDAGALLAASTHALRDAVRAATNGPSEVLLLAFTPTVLDPAMPEMKRANLPTGWAYPAFDRLQVEDYDWLTAGHEARRRAGYAEIDARLGYPTDRQDYMAGFVLLPEDAERFWPLIDAALDEARGRGIAQRYVWALPQIARDGYVRLPLNHEDDMQAFDEVPYPLALGKDVTVSPEFSTTVAVTASGHERRNSLWADARLHYDVGPGIRSESVLGTLIAFFRARRGAARGFLLTDPFDNTSNGMIDRPTGVDQLLGIGDGATASFRLVKRYGEGEEAQERPITRPRDGTITVGVDGAQRFDWQLLSGGWIAFETAPDAGAEVRAGFRFDVPVRFEQDRLDVGAVDFAAGEAPSVPLVEIREAS